MVDLLGWLAEMLVASMVENSVDLWVVQKAAHLADLWVVQMAANWAAGMVAKWV